MRSDTFIKAMGNIDERFLDVEVPKRKIRRMWTAWVAGAAAAVLLIACPLPAMTAFGSDEAYNVLYSISPRIAQDFKPVRKSCTDDDIEMTVVSAKREGSRAEVYLTMRDTTGECPYGDWDLYDSYRLNLWRDMSGCCKFDEYDEETHTAHFIIVLNTMDGSPMPKGKITFSVSELLLGKKETKGDIDADLSAIPTEPETMHRDDISGYSSYSGDEPDYRDFRFLVPNDEPLCRPADNVSMDAIGYVDGELHVLMRYEDNFHTDSHGFVSLVDRDGGEVVSEEKVKDFTYWSDAQHTDMCYEYVIPVEYDRLADCSLYGDFYTALDYRKGKWQVTFPLE
ncbi:MAG: hypothetical protein IKW87_11635 [Ruminococcus sp.]|nr:hypothetical protein [Ruminococcus sp.]